MSTEVRNPEVPPAAGTAHPGLALLVLVTAELMVVLDATIVNIALPSIRTDLGMSVGALSWIVTAYALAFGGLMLLGGRAGDLFGRRRVFRLGIVVFVLASLLGGLAPTAALLIGARILQGVGAAITAPTALSLITTTFAEGRLRNRAMGAWAAMAGIGSTIGLLLGGVITQYLDWRWVLLLNIPIGIAVLAGTVVLREPDRDRGGLGLLGALTGTGGLLALVYAISRGGEPAWYAGAAGLLVAFAVIQARSRNPMLPARVLRDRTRAGSYATMFFVGMGMFATFYFLTLYVQQVLGYSAIRAGLAYLPFNVGVGIMAAVSSRLVARVPPRVVSAPGLVVAAGGMAWLSTLTPHSSYWTTLMPAMFLVALGLGATFVPMTLCSVRGVADSDSGIAAAVLNTAQQIGGAVGLAVLAAISQAYAHDRLDGAETYLNGNSALLPQALDALTYGYTRAFVVAGAVFLVALAIVATVVNAGPQDRGTRPAG
ncbi:MFS transporter [Micromonospora sp. CA-259024]|uniref:MFS transporter n=1 Tax=Micromonospora sp. CA-259024 TaxID=3239965 RepID=UPI003D8A2935